MEFFCLDKEFNSFEEVRQAKIGYEKANNVILSKSDCHKLKGDGDLVKNIMYYRFSLTCKAGKERKSKAKGMRQVSTIKRNCPMKINLTFRNNKLKVTSIHEVHANHQMNPQTFRHYPENVRLSPEEEKMCKSMVEADANKKKVKDILTEIRLASGNNAPVLLKSVHNVQTKTQKEKENLLAGENELQKLLDSMLKVPGAIVRVLKDENDELVCVYFQDSRMTEVFDKFPELLLFDATYRMNNREMPLFIQSVVDGNGETEIACIGICRSESNVVVEFILDTFKSLNHSWTKVKCVVGDKDFADRIVYTEKFDGISLQICLFHVMRTFNREITTCKRSITKEQRVKALEILQSMCYARSVDIYDNLYEKLTQLDLPEVMDYFNENWRNIRDEWVLYGRNECSNYFNSTNNRSESMNKNLKSIGTRHANLLKFFENLSTSIRVMASEKDAKAVRQDMRTVRVIFDDPALRNYNSLLTPFIFTKLKDEYENRDNVEFVLLDSESAMTNYGRLVTRSTCSCTFHKNMILPCRHIFKFRERNETDLFALELCDQRWTKQYYQKSHPALTMNGEIATVAPIYVQRIQTPAEKDKYKASASITKDINSLLSSMSVSEFHSVFPKLKKFRDDLQSDGCQHENLEDEGNQSSVEDEVIVQNDVRSPGESEEHSLDLSAPTSSAMSNLAESSVLESRNQEEINEIRLVDRARQHEELSCRPTMQDQLNESQVLIVASTSSQQIRSLKLPSKRRTAGRPKGSVNNAIGLKRKNAPKVQSKKKVKVAPMIPQSVQSDRVLRGRNI